MRWMIGIKIKRKREEVDERVESRGIIYISYFPAIKNLSQSISSISKVRGGEEPPQ
jgi:hypothetical protein